MGIPNVFDPAFSSFIVQLPQKLENCFKSQLRRLGNDNEATSYFTSKENQNGLLTNSVEVDLDRQLQPWRENPTWHDPIPEIKVSIPKGSLCNLKVEVNVGLPPDAVYNIVTDSDNKRVFKNIKEVISRRVIVDEGSRQVVEVEQAALWKFLWWSGTISVHVLVDQNRDDHSMKFKQVKSGFMKRFEGCWSIEPMFVDKSLCFPFEPTTFDDYCRCTGGKGRVGSKLTLDQLIEPAIIPPPPISWYLRGITTKTTEMLIIDLLAETARIRRNFDPKLSREEMKVLEKATKIDESHNIKERWALRKTRRCHKV